MNELEAFARNWGATAVPFGPLADLQWLDIPSQQRAWSLLNQTVGIPSMRVPPPGLDMSTRRTGPGVYFPLRSCSLILAQCSRR